MDRIARPVAATLLAACVGMAAFAFASLWVPGTEALPQRPAPADVLAFLTIFLTFPAVGAAIVWKQPGNPVGWLFLVIGSTITFNVFASEYVALALQLHAPLPAPELVAWIGGWSWNIGAAIALPLALMLFPSGRLPGPYWRWPVVVGVAGTLVVVAALAVRPGYLIDQEGLVRNPFGIGGPLGELAMLIAHLELAPMASMIILSLVALTTRSRRTPTERQQLKWLLYPVAVLVIALFGLALPTGIEALWSLVLAALAAIPVCAGIAILRYRLYDIDVVIRRTLVYGVVVGVLAVVYVALVLVLQGVLTQVTGGESLPVALSTLAIAALFGPVRARARSAVDRRFYRSRYDAQRTLETFAGRLRGEVELDAVAVDLVAAAHQAVRPIRAGLWIRQRGAG